MLVVVYVVYCVLCSIGDRPFNYPVLYVWDFLSAGLFSANGDRNDDTLIYYNEVPIQKTNGAAASIAATKRVHGRNHPVVWLEKKRSNTIEHSYIFKKAQQAK